MLEPRSESIKQITDLIDATTTFDIKKRPLLIGDLVEVVARLEMVATSLCCHPEALRWYQYCCFLAALNGGSDTTLVPSPGGF